MKLMKLAEKYQQKVCRHLGKNYIQIMSRNTHSTISITKSSSNWSIIRKSKPKHKAPNLPNQTKPYFQNHTHTHIKFLIHLEKGKCKIPFEIVWFSDGICGRHLQIMVKTRGGLGRALGKVAAKGLGRGDGDDSDGALQHRRPTASARRQ